MGETELNALIQKLESAEPFGHRDKEDVADAIDALIPDRSIWPEAREDRTESADVALHVAEKLFPNWHVKLTGTTSAAHGHWVCELRKSATQDDDEVIGVGTSPVLAHAIFAACLKLAAQQHHV